MARIVPSDLTRLILSGAHGGEIATLELLEKQLGHEFTVYHGVHWTRVRNNRTVFGEIDFVVVNSAGEILVIEQKNGPLAETGNGLVKHYENGPKNVESQIRRNIDSIREKFRRQNPAARGLEVDYLFHCPDHRVKKLDATGLDADRIVDARRRGELARTARDLLGKGMNRDPGFTDAVHGFFRQTFEVVPDVRSYIDMQERTFSRLNTELCDLIDRIEMSPLRLRIQAAAGCGKTGVAIRFFERAVKDGKRPLLVCFNRPLRDRLKSVLPDSGLVQTWYGLCATFLESRGVNLEFRRVRSDPDFWAKVQDRVIEQEAPQDWKFDCLVIDEAQDFDPEWFQVLDLFMNDPHDVLWLEDPAQNIRQAEPPAGSGYVGYSVRDNYRSPYRIARFIRSVLPFEFECVNDLPGLGVRVTPYDDPAEQPRLAAGIITDLVRRGFRAGDMTLLTMLSHDKSVLSECETVGQFTVRRFIGYDSSGNQIMSDGQIHFDSVGRFKGQEAPAVILCDIDPDPESGRPDRWERLLYCGMTRATVRLELIVKGSHPLYHRWAKLVRSHRLHSGSHLNGETWIPMRLPSACSAALGRSRPSTARAAALTSIST